MCCKEIYYSVVCKEGHALYDWKCKKGWGGNYKRIANGGGDLNEGDCTHTQSWIISKCADIIGCSNICLAPFPTLQAYLQEGQIHYLAMKQKCMHASGPCVYHKPD